MKGKLGDIGMRMLVMKYGRKWGWKVVVRRDRRMCLVKGFEVYEIRWKIEVMKKESKEYVGLGGYEGCEFNGEIGEGRVC